MYNSLENGDGDSKGLQVNSIDTFATISQIPSAALSWEDVID